MYHYVRSIRDTFSKNLYFLKVNEFKDQIKYFKKNYVIVDHEEFYYIIKKKPKLKKKIMFLTFDDGYLDHYKYVYPILKKNKISGSFYVPSKILQKGYILDVNKIHLILSQENNLNKIMSDIINYTKEKFNFIIDSKKLNLINSASRFDSKKTIIIKRLLQYHLPFKIRTNLNKFLFKKYVSKYTEEISNNMYLSEKNIKEMASDGMYFGSHGHNHEWMEFLNKKEQTYEINKSFKFLNKIEKKIKNFSICYPYGSYNKSTIKILKNKKFSYGFTSRYGNINLKKNFNLFEIPRFDANDFK